MWSKLTVSSRLWIWSRFLKVKDNSALDFLNQRLKTLIQHPLSENRVRAPWKTQAMQQLDYFLLNY